MVHLRISHQQYADLVRGVENALRKGGETDHDWQSRVTKGGGPDDYSIPQVMEYYLYRHPMSMMEFYVDSGGIAGGGLFKKFKTSFKKIVKGVLHASVLRTQPQIQRESESV